MRLGLFFKEGRRRKLSPLWSRIVGVLVVLFAAVELYGAPFGFIDSFILRSLFVSFAITLTFICYTPIRTEPGQSENVPVPDILLACISLAAGAYMVLNGAELVTRWTGVDPLTPADWAVTATFVLLTLEVTRRTVGPVLLGIILVFIVYNFVGPNTCPAISGTAAPSLEVFLDRMAYTYDGILGTPGRRGLYLRLHVRAVRAGLQRGGRRQLLLPPRRVHRRTHARRTGQDHASSPAPCTARCPAASGVRRRHHRQHHHPADEAPRLRRDVLRGRGGIGLFRRFASCRPIMGTAAFLMVDVAGIPYHRDRSSPPPFRPFIYYFGLMMQVHYRAVHQGNAAPFPTILDTGRKARGPSSRKTGSTSFPSRCS